MNESYIIESFLNDSSIYSKFIKEFIESLYKTNKSVYLFGGLLRECIFREKQLQWIS